jgi:hypothetical protein
MPNIAPGKPSLPNINMLRLCPSAALFTVYSMPACAGLAVHPITTRSAAAVETIRPLDRFVFIAAP